MHRFLKFIIGIKLYMFRTVPLSIVTSFSLYTKQWYMSYRFADSLRAGSGFFEKWMFITLLRTASGFWRPETFESNSRHLIPPV